MCMTLILHTDYIGIEVQLQRETFQQKVKYFHQQRQKLSLNGEAKTHLGFYLIVKKIFSEKCVKKPHRIASLAQSYHLQSLEWTTEHSLSCLHICARYKACGYFGLTPWCCHVHLYILCHCRAALSFNT